MKKALHILCADRDRQALEPVLDTLRARGLRISEDPNAGKGGLVLAVLSESMYADPEKTRALLELVGAGAETVLPLQLDAAPIPEALKKALYTRNIIPAAGRDPEQLAERIAAAIPSPPPVLPKILIAAALVLAMAGGALIWRALQARSPAVPATNGTEIAIPEGWTTEDLARIEDVVIVGDQVVFLTGEELEAAMAQVQTMLGSEEPFPFIYFDAERYAVLDENSPDGQIRWYGMDSGQELRPARHEDLRFLSLMPNLRYLSLVLAEIPAEGLPDLRAAEKLEGVAVLSCGIEDLSWLSGSSVRDLMIRFSPIRDLSPLTACEQLRLMHLDMRGAEGETSLSAFSPPNLENASLWFIDCSAAGDLSFLSGLSGLRSLQLLEPAGLGSLVGLEGLALEELEIVNGYDLRDLSALSSLQALRSLTLDDCPSVRDYRPVGDCRALESLMLYAGWDVRLQDASFLASLPELREIRLYSIDLPDLDFLRGLGQVRSSLDTFDFSGGVGDFSALSAIGHYNMLGIDLYGGRMDRVLPELADTTVSYLYLRRIGGLDLAALPRVEDRLFLNDCDLRDLSALPTEWPISSLQLYDCAGLRSLAGLEKLPAFRGDGEAVLEVYHCPNLADWSALDGLRLSSLLISSCYTLPSFRDLEADRLHLESIPELTDLRFLELSKQTRFSSLELAGLDRLSSLEPLRRFRGDRLTVPPQLEEQARDLVEDGVFSSYTVDYPRGGWDPENDRIFLQSLDELETLPPAMLRRVESLCLVGDAVVDLSSGELRETWIEGQDRPVFEYFDRQSGLSHPIEYSDSGLRDLDFLGELTGLRRLVLYAQSLEDLEGIQSLENLEELTVRFCPELRDASAAFSLPQLRSLDLSDSAVDSIRGVQNLRSLEQLCLRSTAVSDLRPVLELEALETLELSANMAEAIASLDGQSYGFQLNITD